LRWDDTQEPWVQYTTDSDGWITFNLRGGGCAEAGTAAVYGGSFCYLEYPGAKSPDVNGDCLVGQDDRDYVVARLGSDDFCGDVDGNGIVDAADLEVVDGTLGDYCTQLSSGVQPPEAGSLMHGMGILAHPNPARSVVRLLVTGGMERSVAGVSEEWEIAIFDAGGREVRRLAAGRGPRWVQWDLTDDAGRDVGSGWYMAVFRSDEGKVCGSVLVAR